MFASTELPVVDCMYHEALTMVDDGRSLALVSVSRPRGYIWALERSGDDDRKSWSWIQVYTFATAIPEYALLYWKVRFLWLK